MAAGRIAVVAPIGIFLWPLALRSAMAALTMGIRWPGIVWLNEAGSRVAKFARMRLEG
jgi:hypothetical protein